MDWRNALSYGFLVWLIPFIASFLIFPLRESNRPLFESIMPVVLVAVTVVFAVKYFTETKPKNAVKEGVLLGITWFLVSIAIDLLMFSWGPMKMTFTAYMEDIGLTYLLIPVITIGFGYLLENRR